LVWLYITLVFTCAANAALLWRRHSRYRGLSVVALLLAALALASGLSIGFLIAPVALALSTIAIGLQISRSSGSGH